MSERHVTVGGVALNVAEGPDNGLPLVLLHGQASRWQDHRRVLPHLVRGLLLEDPPLFSSVMPRGDSTTGGVLHRLAEAYLREPPDVDFQRYYLEHADYFAFFGGAAARLTRWALRRVDRHPGRPLRI